MCIMVEQTNEIVRIEKLGKTTLNYIVPIASVLVTEHTLMSSLMNFSS